MSLVFNHNLPKNWFLSFDIRRRVLKSGQKGVVEVKPLTKEDKIKSFKTKVRLTDKAALENVQKEVIVYVPKDHEIFQERLDEYGVSLKILRRTNNFENQCLCSATTELTEVISEILSGNAKDLVLCTKHKEELKECGFEIH